MQRHYSRDKGYLGEAGAGHQMKLALKPFAEAKPYLRQATR
jgi:hypothetical protein